jgi:ATP-dependent Lhr-like helicase
MLRDRGACFFRELSIGSDESATIDALWDLVWSGEVTNDGYTSLRAFLGRKATVAGARGRAVGVGTRARIGRRLNSVTVVGPPKAQGRWSLVERELLAGAPSPTECLHALAGALLERHGVLTREAVRGEGILGGFSRVYPVLRALEESGRIRRGYAVEGLGGAQFALPGAIDRLRTFREVSSTSEPATLVLAACDPANPHGVTLPWPQIDGVSPRRVPGAFVVFVNGQISLYLEKGARTVSALRPFDGMWEVAAVRALATLADSGRVARLTLNKFPEQLREALLVNGFVPSPKGLARYPRS